MLPSAVYYSERFRRGMERMLFLALCVLVSPFLFLIRFVHPAADDYCLAIRYTVDTLWAAVKGEYLGWEGRYFAITTAALFHRELDLHAVYPYALITLLLGVAVAIFVLLQTLLAGRLSAVRVAGASLVAWAYFVLTLPAVNSGFFWFDAARQYQLGNILLLLSLAALVSMSRAQTVARGAVMTALAGVLVFATVGTNEIHMLFLLPIVVCCCGLSWWKYPGRRVSWSVVLLIAAACGVVVVISPGTAIRLTFMPERHQLIPSLTHSLYYAFTVLSRWITEPAFWAIVVLSIPLALRLADPHRGRIRVSGHAVVLAIGLWMGLLWMAFFAVWWSTFGNPAPRVLNTIYLFFFLGGVAIAGMLALLVWQRAVVVPEEPVFSPGANLVLGIAAIVLVTELAASPNFRRALDDLAMRAHAYDQLMKARYDTIAHAMDHGQDRVSVPDVRDALPEGIPWTILFDDIREHPSDWRNRCYASYFGLDAIQTGMRSQGADGAAPPEASPDETPPAPGTELEGIQPGGLDASPDDASG